MAVSEDLSWPPRGKSQWPLTPWRRSTRLHKFRVTVTAPKDHLWCDRARRHI